MNKPWVLQKENNIGGYIYVYHCGSLAEFLEGEGLCEICGEKAPDYIKTQLLLLAPESQGWHRFFER